MQRQGRYDNGRIIMVTYGVPSGKYTIAWLGSFSRFEYHGYRVVFDRSTFYDCVEIMYVRLTEQEC